jgi:phthalate 4,5-dioxygenase oxygenase subunit
MRDGNFTGIQGIPNQDMAMWVSMGRVTDRTRDRLGASDLAVVEFRKQMIEAVRAVADGSPAIGTGAQATPTDVCSFQHVIPKTIDWRDYDAHPIWLGVEEAQAGTDQNYAVKA